MPPQQKARQYLASRKKAYARVFQGTGIDGQIVLEDLAKFCRASASTFHPDARVSDVLVGRREVILRIQQHIQLDDEALWRLYGNPTLTNVTELGSD